MSEKLKECYRCGMPVNRETTYYSFGPNLENFLCEDCYNKVKLLRKIKQANPQEQEVLQ